jgi:hypothetical protein
MPTQLWSPVGTENTFTTYREAGDFELSVMIHTSVARQLVETRLQVRTQSVASSGDSETTTYDLFGASRFLGITLLLTSGLAALISLILRLHHTRGIECQQLKWFLFAAVPLTLFLGLIELDLLVLNLSYDFYLRFDFLFNNGTSIFPSW